MLFRQSVLVQFTFTWTFCTEYKVSLLPLSKVETFIEKKQYVCSLRASEKIPRRWFSEDFILIKLQNRKLRKSKLPATPLSLCLSLSLSPRYLPVRQNRKPKPLCLATPATNLLMCSFFLASELKSELYYKIIERSRHKIRLVKAVFNNCYWIFFLSTPIKNK